MGAPTSPSGLQRIPAWAADTLVFTGIALWLTWPILRSLTTSALGDFRDSPLNIAQLDHVQRTLLAGRFTELWNAPIFHPHPATLTWTEHLVGIAVVMLPLRLFTQNPVAIYNLATIAALALNGMAASYLGRVLAGRWVGLCVGVLYAMAPGRLAHLMHIQHEFLFLPPLALALLCRFSVEKRPALLLWAAAAVSWQVVMVPSHSIYLLFLFALPALATLPSLRTLQRSTVAGISLALVGLGMIAWWSVQPYTLLQAQYGFIRTVGDGLGHAATWQSLITVDAHHDVGGWWLKKAKGTTLESTLWVGSSLLTASLLGLLFARHRTRVSPGHPTVLALTALLTLVMCFVPRSEADSIPLPGEWLWHHLPFLQQVRGFSRFYLFMLVALTALAALGLDQLFLREPRRAPAWTLLLTLWCCVELCPGPVRAHTFADQARLPPVYRLVQEQQGPFMELPYRLHGNTALNDYYTTLHHGRTANGYSGFYPPMPVALRYLVNTLPMEPALTVIQRLGVRSLILFTPGTHAAEDDTFPTLRDAATSGTLPDGINYAGKAGEGLAFNVAAVPAGVWTFAALDVEGLHVPSQAPAEGRLVTASLLTRVSNPPSPNITPQLPVTLELRAEDGSITRKSVILRAPPILYSPSVPVEFQFRAPSRAGRYALTLLGPDARVLGTAPLSITTGLPHSARDASRPTAEVKVQMPLWMRPKHTVLCAVTVTNTGQDWWLANAGETLHERRFDMRLGYHWEDQKEPLSEVRLDLPWDVAPGESVDIVVPLRAPSNPGEHRVTVGLLRQLIAWLPAGQGRSTFTVRISEQDPGLE